MKPERELAMVLLIAALLSTGCVAQAPKGHSPLAADAPAPGSRNQHADHGAGADPRQLVSVPDDMRTHTLTSMRDHLLALAQIQDALANGAFDEAAQIAEQRLGMTSLKAHGAHESSRFMPQGMQEIGTAMHHGASRFAIEAQNASASGDLKPALAALARTTQACVACHADYRLQ
jgi:hypothetical protein